MNDGLEVEVLYAGYVRPADAAIFPATVARPMFFLRTTLICC
jgi:hypothetical protein